MNGELADLRTLAITVAQMRKCQKRWFEHHDPEDLRKCRYLEALVDEALTKLDSGQGRLFPTEAPYANDTRPPGRR